MKTPGPFCHKITRFLCPANRCKYTLLQTTNVSMCYMLMNFKKVHCGKNYECFDVLHTREVSLSYKLTGF